MIFPSSDSSSVPSEGISEMMSLFFDNGGSLQPPQRRRSSINAHRVAAFPSTDFPKIRIESFLRLRPYTQPSCFEEGVFVPLIRVGNTKFFLRREPRCHSREHLQKREVWLPPPRQQLRRPGALPEKESIERKRMPPLVGWECSEVT